MASQLADFFKFEITEMISCAEDPGANSITLKLRDAGGKSLKPSKTTTYA